MYKIKCLYREFTSFEGSLFKYSLSFSLLLALAPSLLIFALMFKFAYLDDTIILNFIMNFIPDGNLETINQLFSFLRVRIIVFYPLSLRCVFPFIWQVAVFFLFF